MARLPKRSEPRALTASASALRGRNQSQYSTRLSQPAQLRCLSYYDNVGEISFASSFYAKLLSRVRFFPARQNEDGTVEPIEDGLPMQVLHRIQDPGGGRSRLQFDYGRFMFVTGECVLFGDKLGTEDERWRFLWKDEVKYDDVNGMWERVRYDKTSYDPPEYGVGYRFWSPHPRHSDLAWSPLMSVMDIAEELIILTASVRSTAVSRMTNGILVMASEASPNPQGTYEGDEDPESNVLLSDLIEHTTATIESPGTAEGRTPFLFEGPSEYITPDLFRWMSTHDPQTDYMEKDLRTEAIKRLALGLDFPPEFLLGMTDANHWTAKAVVHDMWRSYGSPIAERLGDDLADAILRPTLRDEGYDGWENIVLTFDDSQVVVSPDKTVDALNAYKAGLLNAKRARLDMGYTEDDKPDDEEHEEWLAIQLRDGQILPPDERPALAPPAAGPMPNGNGKVDASNGPPLPTQGRDGSRQESRTAAIQGAAAAALMRCRELAGVRIRHKCDECGEGQPLSLVASTVDAEMLESPMRLVQGGTDFFKTLLSEWGFEERQSVSLCQQLEVFAARTLADKRCPELPSGFLAAIEKAKEVSDALVNPTA